MLDKETTMPNGRVIKHGEDEGMSEVEVKVRSSVAVQLDIKVESIKNSDRFEEELGADSLDTLELLMEMEEIFSIEIGDREASEIKTVQQAIDHMELHGK